MTNPNVDKYVLSLYDYTGEALVPWAEAGYSCIAFDIQHDDTVTDVFGSGGSIKYVKADLHDQNCLLYTSPSPRDRTRTRMPSSA